MAAIQYEVARAFTNRKPKTSGAFVSVGDAIYSYGMKLAHWEDDTIRFDYTRKDMGGKAPSVTTSRHMSALEAIAKDGMHG